MDNIKELLKQLEEERNIKVGEIHKKYQDKMYKALLNGWNLKEGITKLKYISDRDGYIEGTFKGLSRSLKITIDTYSCNGFECNGVTTSSYKDFILK